MEWQQENLPKKNKFKTAPSQRNLWLQLFYSGGLFVYTMLRGIGLKKLQDRLSRIQLRRQKQDILLLYDNATSYVSQNTMNDTTQLR
jgi:hypothetical protein